MSLNLSNYKRISGLTEKTELETGDVFAVDNSTDAASQKITYASLRSLLKTYFKLGSLAAGHYTAGNSYAADLGLLDTQLYDVMGIINKAFADIATVQNSSTASQAFTSGQFLIYQDQLYMVTADIAQGGTITVGTNVTAVTVGTALITATLALAAAYNSSTQYSVGDICTHAGSLYVCSGSTTGTWDSTKWVNKTVAQLILSILSDISTINTALSGKQDTLTFDNAPTQNSSNPVKSGGVYTAIQTEATARTQMDTNIKAGTLAQKAYHMGFYLDADGDLCQA